jgi:hypothetical protein
VACHWLYVEQIISYDLRQVVGGAEKLRNVLALIIIIIIIINPCKPYLTASAPRLTHWGGGK